MEQINPFQTYNLNEYKLFKTEDDLKVFERYIIDFLNDFYETEKDSFNPLVLSFNDVQKYFPIEFNIIENWEKHYDDMMIFFQNVVLDWSGKKRKIFFQVPEGIFEKHNYFNLTNDFMDKVIKINVTVDNIKEYEDISTSIKVKCLSCGKIWKEVVGGYKYKQCLGSEGGCDSQKLSRKPDNFVSRRYIDLSDPSQTEGSCAINGYIDIFSKVDRIIFPEQMMGQDLQLLGMLRLEKYFQNYIRKFEIIGIKFDRFKGLKKHRIKEIENIVQEDENIFENVAFCMSRNVSGMDYIKLLFLAGAIGLNYPDEQFGDNNVGINAMIIGSPAISKSRIMKNLTKYFFKARKISAKSVSKAGMIGGVDVFKGTEKKSIVAGEISRCHNGILFIDECKHLSDDVKAALLTSMSEGWHSIKFAGINFTFKYNVNIFLIGNPKYGNLLPDTPLKDQVDFDPEFISRCFITTKAVAYFKNEDGSIDMDKLNEVFVIKRINEEDKKANVSNVKYNERFLQDYANTVKTIPNPTLEKEGEIRIEKYVKTFADKTNVINTFHDGEEHSTSALDLRSLDALKILSKIIARGEFSSIVQDKHIDMAIDIYENTMVKFKQLYKNEMPENIETEMIETNKKVYPKSKNEKIQFVLSQIPRGKEIEWSELLSLCIKHAISEFEVEEIITKNKMDILEPHNGFFSRM